MAVGFVLITTETGKETQVREAIGKIEMVEQRWGIFGEFDVLVKVVADDEIDLTRCIMEEIRIIDGILDTRTLIGSQI
ncbi:MAG: AsnC family transcriptional regulator [Euryarchaeota archaeon]|jgi:DNA-binding Lrp family transcriptional regulator|nr:AsnC family transcriptional regulator [Euryarchaeota archaeon]|tara:strand:- start:206 stop:439 length:234 start_codon:yes stop_codon:yes gene_type:complete